MAQNHHFQQSSRIHTTWIHYQGLEPKNEFNLKIKYLSLYFLGGNSAKDANFLDGRD